MTFKKYCINRNIEEAVQILEYLESQGVMEEGVLGNLAGRAAKGVVDAGVAVGKRALDTAVSGVGRGAIEGGKRALSVAMGKGKDPGPMIKNAISNLTDAGKLGGDELSREFIPIIKKLNAYRARLHAAKTVPGGFPLSDKGVGDWEKTQPRAPKTTSTAMRGKPDPAAAARARAGSAKLDAKAAESGQRI